MKPLFAREFQHIFFNLSFISRPDRVAEGLRSLAYKLEGGVIPARAQRERIVGAMRYLPEMALIWTDYSVRLWFYISAAQLKDARLAHVLSSCMQQEVDAHLRVWCCLAADQSASSEFAFNSSVSSQLDLARIAKNAQILGLQHTSLYPLMQSVLSTGFGILRETAQLRFDDTAPDDIKFLLLALGRGQIRFENNSLAIYLKEALVSDGIQHDDPTVSEYSLWAARIINVPGVIRPDLLLNIPCWQHDGVRHAGYKVLAKDMVSRRENREFLRDARKVEDKKGRLNIALALTTRAGSYDSVMRNADREDIADALTWHSNEVDEATGCRLFDFLVRNSKDNQEVVDYIISEMEAEDLALSENLRTLNRRSQELPIELSELRNRANEKLKDAQRSRQASFIDYSWENSKMKPDKDVTNFIVVAADQELAAIREYNKSMGFIVKGEQEIAKRNGDIIMIPIENDFCIKVGLVLASRKGSESMTELLGSLDQFENPRWVILVGMMAGLKGKAGILDVIAPQTIWNGQAVGTSGNMIKVEHNGAMVDPVLHDYLHSGDKHSLKKLGIKLTTHKHTVTVAAKMDDWLHELCQKILAVDSENIVGLEMEGWAIAQRQNTQSRSDRKTGFIMVKGVADYAGGALDEREIMELKEIASLSGLMDNPDPTNSREFKGELQRLATIRAYEVAINLLRRANKAR